MDIHVFNQQSDLRISESSVQSVVKDVLRLENCQCDEVSVHFVSTKTICELHDQFFDDPSVTDCISLPIDTPGEIGFSILGEIFVCPATAISFAKEHGIDPYEEVTLYIVHGLLHLVGYDDIGDAEPAMRAAEEKHIKNLRGSKLVLYEPP